MRLLELLREIERTMLVATHDLPLAAELCEWAVILSAGRIVADGPSESILSDRLLLADHDLELPAGFDLSRVRRTLPRRPEGGRPMTEHDHEHDEPHAHEHEHDGETHSHAHTEHDHEHTEHDHEHEHPDGTVHSHPHPHEKGLEDDHEHSH